MNLEFVSLLSLIHAPEIYHGQAIRVIGLCSFGADTAAMWATQEHYRQSVTKNAIYLDLPPDADLAAFHGKVMLIEGIFSAENRGPHDFYSGGIEQMSRIAQWR
jgi:hypothetical protein